MIRRTRGDCPRSAKAGTVARVLTAVLLSAITLFAQQRDTPPPVAASATGEISGSVVTADANPQPLRRVVVTVTGGSLNPRSVLTDDGGRFTFAKLPAGTYSVTARKAAYLAASYGARKPGRAGMPVALAAGQRADVTISMFRGAAISGVLRDAAGLPVSGVDVRVIDPRTLLTLSNSSPTELATTDDRGVFRIYGLLPGDYLVVALPMPGGSGEIVAPPASAIDNALSTLASRRPVDPATPASSVLPPQRPIGFSPIFFPGTPNYAEAARVHIDAGDDRMGVDFQMSPVPMAAIEGVVRGDLANLSGLQVTIVSSGPRVSTVMSSNSLSGRPVDAQGLFQYANLPPGTYRLIARARRGAPEVSSLPVVVNGVAQGRSGGSVTAPPAGASTGEYLYGVADVELRGDDVAGVTLTLQPGGSITGRVVFTGTGALPKLEDLTRVRMSLTLDGATGMVSSNGLMMGNSLISSSASTVKPDGTFEIRSIGPGRFTLGAGFTSSTDAPGWKLRSAIAGDRNLLDDLIDLGPGVDVRDVVVTFSDARTEISGTLQTDSGVVTTDYYIVALPADRALWRPKSRRVLSVRPATDGRFVFADLPAGEYVIAALSDLDPTDLTDAAFLEQIAPAGIKVTVAEGEKKIQDLKIR